ncbi:MAG: hypothetical protein IT364_04575 [Candidatus Hydrogenedentes bacterium]|nr:hypothetical protein [Candidatus Hydrogenedentota bacterium]
MTEEPMTSTFLARGIVTFELNVQRIDVSGSGGPPAFVPLEMGCFFVKRPRRHLSEGPVALANSLGTFVAEGKWLKGDWSIQVMGFDANRVFYEGAIEIEVKRSSLHQPIQVEFYLTPA